MGLLSDAGMGLPGGARLVPSSSPYPVARACSHSLDPEEDGHRVPLECPALDYLAEGLHLNGGAFAVPDGNLALASSVARAVPVCPVTSDCVSSATSVGLDSGKDCSEGDHDLKADLVEQFVQERIPASEKMKWRLDGSSSFLQDFNASGSL